jgi:DNA polymerase-3 subunit epsilon
MREIVLDTETTGIGFADGHRVIEIGAVELIDKYRTGKFYHTYINPERDVAEGAFKVHGLSTEFLKDKPVFALVVAEFLDFIGDSKLVIHNAPFDMGFLNHHLTQLGVTYLNNDRVIDTLELARKKYPGAKNSLDALCARLNVDSSARIHHGALLDAELLADCYSEMMGAGSTQRNLLFQTATVETIKVETQIILSASGQFHEPREFALTDEEAAEHEKFLESIKNPLWKALAS